MNVAHATALSIEKKHGEQGFRVVAYFPPGSLPDESARGVRLHHAPTRREAGAWAARLMRQIEERDTVSVRVSVD